MDKLKVEYVSTEELKPYKNNAKIHTDEQIDQIARSIEEFGMNDPIAVWKDGEIIEGHGRLMACQKLGITEVPIIRLDGLTDEQRRAYMNVHNQLTMNTGFDIDLLAEELGKIENIDMSLFGFELPEDGTDTDETFEDEYVETDDIPKRAEPGDVFELGNHRLMCGDSTKKEDVEKLLGGGVMQFVCNGSSVQCCGEELAWNDHQERQHGHETVYRVLDIGIQELGDGAVSRRRFLCLVRGKKRGGIPCGIPGGRSSC